MPDIIRRAKRSEMQADNANAWKGQGTGTSLVATVTNSPELEVKDAHLIFGAVWRDLEGEFGRSGMRFPRELILLGGAPGAGKGTNSDFIRKVRGIDAPPIVISKLLNTPEARAVKSRGGMVGDREVVSILLRKLLEPEQQNGALLDGFPRTKVQVECLKLLYDEMIALRREFYDTQEVIHFKQPIFQIMVLFVDEAESVARQLKRGRQVVAHNEEIARSGVGERWEERATGLQRGARTQPLPRLQGANLRRAGFPQRDLPLPLHQRPGAYSRSAGQYRPGARIPELAGVGPAHV